MCDMLGKECSRNLQKFLRFDDPQKLNHENAGLATSSKFTCLENLYAYGIRANETSY